MAFCVVSLRCLLYLIENWSSNMFDDVFRKLKILSLDSAAGGIRGARCEC